MVHPIRAAAEFAGSLRSPEKKDADYGDFAAVEVEHFLQAVFELGHTAISSAGWACETLLLQCAEGMVHGFFVQGHHWIAIIFLVAGVDQIRLCSGQTFAKRTRNGASAFY